MWWHEGSAGSEMWGILFGLIVITVVILGVLIFLVLAMTRRESTVRLGPSATLRPGPEELLAERFARGEIDADDYAHSLEILRQREKA